MSDDAFRNQLRSSRINSEEKDKTNRLAARMGRFRQMINSFHGKTFYSSTFYPDTGTLIRITDDCDDNCPQDCHNDYLIHLFGLRSLPPEAKKEWEDKYQWDRNYNGKGFSPVPETIDVAINSWCNYGCSYCYTNATTRGQHADIQLIRMIIDGLQQPPYQMALGGGSPTQHPQFIQILELIKSYEVVPNYTTEGQNLTPEILAATARLCGGVALTFHSEKGTKLFIEAYQKLNHLNLQLNVHLIVDRHILDNLQQLWQLTPQLGLMNLVLLAYYPDVGRSSLVGMMPKNIYMEQLPPALKKTLEMGHRIAFSEGLIPYFLSRPEIGIDTRLLTPIEGNFSCAIDIRGRLTESSFYPTRWEEAPTVFDTSTQFLWNHLRHYRHRPSGANCDDCQHQYRCVTPDDTHYFICKFATHNQPKDQPKNQKYLRAQEQQERWMKEITEYTSPDDLKQQADPWP